MALRCSGHESFPCRYAWIPKAADAIRTDPAALDHEDEAMVSLGIGKNMVRAVRFWVQAFGIAAPAKKGLQLTAFGKAVFGYRGRDPFLEDPRTLWLLHWNVSSLREDPLFAWDFVLARWPKKDFTVSELMEAGSKALRSAEKEISPVTLSQHFDVFLRTYLAQATNDAVPEDELDCPLAQIRLIELATDHRRERLREHVYSIRVDEKPEIPASVFVHCLDDFWKRHRPNEKKLSFRDISFAPGGPGAVLKIAEQGVRERLDSLSSDSEGVFDFLDSAAVPGVRRHAPLGDSLARIYAAT